MVIVINTINNKKRQSWIDVIRGICAIFVMFFHIPSSPMTLMIFYSPIMIPAFFFVSGYLSKNYDGNVLKFLYNRVIKLIIFRFIMVFELEFFSITIILKCLKSPSFFIEYITNYLLKVVTGKSQWFISCLIISSIYFIIINKLCNNKPMLMLTVSLALAAFGLHVSTPGVITNWSWDTALVCQLFFVIGYCIKEKQWISKCKFTVKSCILLGILYICLVIIFKMIFGAENIFITVANNTWGFIPVTTILIISGNLFIVYISQKLHFSKLLVYIGQHSLLYFTLGGICMINCYHVLQYIYKITRFEPLSNIYITCITILIVSIMLMLIPCWFSDKFCPALNGNIRLPELSLKKKDSDK